MQTPLVSILIPFKNTEAFIKACLVSVLNQTYTHWELLIVDDASSDSSFNIVKEFAENDDRITLLKNSGSGIIDALRFAFKHSKGAFITRMDSDDIMHSNKLEVLVTNLLKHGKQHIAVGLVNYFSEDGIKEGYKNYEIWLNNLTKTGRNYSEIYKECVIPSPCWMAHRNDLIACDAFNPNRYPEDYDLAFRFYKHQYKCIPCDTVIHDWRDYSSRTSRTHEHYAENHFIDIKLRYFLELDYNPDKSLVIWGAGNKGKTVAKTLIKKAVPFQWICDNPNKIGRDIYGSVLKPFSALKNIKNPQSIITVANKEAQTEIRDYMNTLNLKNVCDYVFFC
ncbi:glycosyltransferase family 2 protein [Flavivirga aquimarina]|uniref:Glycosyltransferase family 2 protein n=1 Tax=Flavivirga aquimarina TaxID=2027862 RepID=A0ABT8WAN0_9FLAO|nr:glycosyltransferase family 2 protein [Flavivirga aquimarina]MDO5970175.1 glycosyltransferase family 2 protein [Flavivirga aquimarina]